MSSNAIKAVAVMKYDHKVKYKGVWYEPFTDIPEIPKSNIMGDYTKTEINRMTTAKLQALAIKIGVENATEITGTELKKIIAEKLSR